MNPHPYTLLGTPVTPPQAQAESYTSAANGPAGTSSSTAQRFSTDLGMMKTFRDALNRFPNVKMVFSILNTILTHELAIYAKTFANCYAAGHWWYTFYPCIIKPMILERLQAVPYPKLIGWYSDSYYVEWTIAKIKLYIRTLANALAEIVEDGYMDEDMALEVARALLWDNNAEIFTLD